MNPIYLTVGSHKCLISLGKVFMICILVVSEPNPELVWVNQTHLAVVAQLSIDQWGL